MPRLGARLLLSLLHQTYHCYLVILAALALCSSFLKRLWRGNEDGGVLAGLNPQAQLPGKRPLAVALIVSESEARDCLIDLHRVLALCRDVGVEHVAVYDAAGTIKAACHHILAEVPLSESLGGGRSNHKQGRGTQNGWGNGCQTEVPDKNRSPWTDGAPRKNGVVKRKEWRPEPSDEVPVARCGGECGCSGQATGGLQEGAGCRRNGFFEGCRGIREAEGDGKSLGQMDALGDDWANSYVFEREHSASIHTESALQVQASVSRTPTSDATYIPTQAPPSLPASSEGVNSRAPALESVNSRLCEPCQAELPGPRAGTAHSEQDTEGVQVGCSRESVSYQTESSELRNRHLGVDATRNGRKVKHRLDEATTRREKAGRIYGGGGLRRLVNGMQGQGGSTAGSNGVSLAPGLCEPKVPVPRSERKNSMTVDFLSEADGKDALGRAAERICWEAWHGSHGPNGPAENGHVLQAADKGGHGAASAEDGVRRLEEDDIDRALAATGGVTREPELVLVFGKVLTLAGFPPWLLRNSEIVHVPSLRGITATCFTRAIEDFARRTQRFGK
ncbi:hypothetical protein KFL_008070030 [Klebsormidium nitens]|uniref:ditrans,polycis-polyprenyl diphosphate synthase [(2E,6E)-farnesyldiphosphate specific] n=1 Tax=Klebsormidium nitens TaxID=105231 RepID=A0A1Y1IL27_KLENI|nr:hypothetical protein KFL_008070030 [Klebsormidium nitens]|eukprot:GAQ91560.1 hypothetical protein KFL_008070030 [Klebsormidium nitens]